MGISIDEPFEDHQNFNFGTEYGQKLYDTSDMSVPQSLAILFTWFCSHPGISKEAFGRLLYLLHSYILPPGNKLPNSYGSARTVIKDYLSPIQHYDCCVNDCIIFRDCAKGKFGNLNTCPDCGSSRYQPGTKISQKQFKYIPLGPRFKRMFADKKVSEIIQSHDIVKEQYAEKVSDIHQSPAWKSKYDANGPFHGDPRGVCLALCTDGTNPFSKEKVSYSMWPIMLSVLNLPPHIRNVHGSKVLAGIVPGKSEPKNLDPYIEILVDEIMCLNGSLFFDAYKEEEFKIKFDIMMHVLDYPGQSKLFHCGGKYT